MSTPGVLLAFGVWKLETQTALEPTAGARKAGRIQAEILALGHLD